MAKICGTPFSVTLPHPHPIPTCWRCLSCLYVEPGFLSLCKLFGVGAVLCCVPVVWRTMETRSTNAYIRNKNVCLHWALLREEQTSGFVLESRKCGVSSVMTDLLSRYFSFRSLQTKLADFSLHFILKEECYNLKSLYTVEEQRK